MYNNDGVVALRRHISDECVAITPECLMEVNLKSALMMIIKAELVDSPGSCGPPHYYRP